VFAVNSLEYSSSYTPVYYVQQTLAYEYSKISPTSILSDSPGLECAQSNGRKVTRRIQDVSCLKTRYADR